RPPPRRGSSAKSIRTCSRGCCNGCPICRVQRKNDPDRLRRDSRGLAALAKTKDTAQKRFKEFYFLTPPEQFIFNHLPKDSKWQLLDNVVSQEEFLKGPTIPADLFALGVSAKE